MKKNALTTAVPQGDDAPMPRASDKQVRAARTKAEAKVGKPAKHKPDAATAAKAQADRINADVVKHQDAAKRKPKASNPPNLKTLGTGDGQTVTILPDSTLAVMVGGEPTIKVAPAIPSTGYQGPMLALRQRLKQGAYKKSANGQPSCGDEVANVLGQLEPLEVIQACLIAMDCANPYLHLNIGQQSMNLRNKLRGKLKHGEFGMGVVREAAEVVMTARPVKEEVKA